MTDRITKKKQLIDYFHQGFKPREKWRIGTEHEKFIFHCKDNKPATYEEPQGIKMLLEKLLECGGEPILEKNNIIGLRYNDGATISLEPGGQFELSGAPLENIHQTCQETSQHIYDVKVAANTLSLGFLGVGMHPTNTRKNSPIMPKSKRYTYMREYMPTKGALGLDMMLRTCTVQVNLDYENETDMAKKFRIGMALQPVITALFANSPFYEGKPIPYLTYRSHIWTDTDPDRCGILPFAFDDGFGFEHYVDYALKIPLYSIKRDDIIHRATHYCFQDFLDGKITELNGELPTIKDWEEHLTTLFPEVRLKQFMEMRGADCGPSKSLCALPAFWVGLLYDKTILEDVYQYIRSWTYDEVLTMRNAVPKEGLKTKFRSRDLIEIARDLLAMAKKGLQNRAYLNEHKIDESVYLEPLFWSCQIKKTPAEEMLSLYYGKWAQNIDNIFKDYAY